MNMADDTGLKREIEEEGQIKSTSVVCLNKNIPSGFHLTNKFQYFSKQIPLLHDWGFNMKWNSFIKLSEMHVNIFIHLILSEQIRFELQYSHIDKNVNTEEGSRWMFWFGLFSEFLQMEIQAETQLRATFFRQPTLGHWSLCEYGAI